MVRRPARPPDFAIVDLRPSCSAFYGWKQEVGLSASIINTAANKGALLALVAMAQTIPVLTGGLDLSVGMVFVLTNCLAPVIVNGDPRMTALGIIGVLIVGLVCGTINGLIVVYGRLQPIIVTLATSAVFFGIALVLAPAAGRLGQFRIRRVHDHARSSRCRSR